MHFDFVPNTLLASGHEKPSIYAGFRAFVQMSRCFQGTNTYLSITIIIIKKFIIILFIFTKTLGQGGANPVFMRVCVVPDLVPNVVFFIWTSGISACSLSKPRTAALIRLQSTPYHRGTLYQEVELTDLELATKCWHDINLGCGNTSE